MTDKEIKELKKAVYLLKQIVEKDQQFQSCRLKFHNHLYHRHRKNGHLHRVMTTGTLNLKLQEAISNRRVFERPLRTIVKSWGRVFENL